MPPAARPPVTTASEVVAGEKLYPPDASEPAAGICAQPEGEVVLIIFNENVADPRCLIVSPNQLAEFMNNAGSAVTAGFATYEFTLQPGERFSLDEPFGAYLAPGVHWVRVSGAPAFAPEIWLVVE